LQQPLAVVAVLLLLVVLLLPLPLLHVLELLHCWKAHAPLRPPTLQPQSLP
jgi:hypothetical protein